MARNNPPLGFKKATLGSVLVSSLCTPALANNDVNAEDDVEHIVVAGQRMNDLNKQDTIATKMDVSIKDTGRSIAVLDEDDLKVLAIQDVR